MKQMLVITMTGLMIGTLSAAAQDARPNAGRRPDLGEMFKRMDANQDGKLTKDEIPQPMKQRLEPIFDRLGKDAITPEDLQKIRERFAGNSRDANRSGGVGQFFDRLDANGDGKITLDEIPERAKERFKPLFERSGKDAISREEFGRFSAARNSRPDQPRPDESRPGERRPGERRPGERRPGERRPGGDFGFRRGQGGAGGPGRPGFGPQAGFRGPAIFQRIDANGDGKVSKEEWSRLVDLFGKLDANGDGFLDPREIFTPPMQRGDRPVRPEGDRPNRPRRPEGDQPDRPRRPEGDRGDRPERPRDGDRPQGGPPSPEQALERFDTDGNGKISKDEAPERMKEHFSQLDANGDGQADADELKKAFQNFRRDRN